MHTDILTEEQKRVLPFISQFKKSYYLVGGTAIALQLGHRRSVDFDLFTYEKIRQLALHKSVAVTGFPFKVLGKDSEQIHFLLNQVKITFFAFPFRITHEVPFDHYINMPDLVTLAAMKAFALGRRAKWKDYVDLYFLLREVASLKEICERAIYLFGDNFSERLFREQLAYHKDIDYTEEVEFMPQVAVAAGEVRSYLVDMAMGGVTIPY